MIFYEQEWHNMSTIKLLVLDVDGVLTNDTIYISPHDEELKRFHIQDGLGINSANH